jgi:chemotaxis protein MotA
MDLATLVGLLAAVGVILGAIFLGGSAPTFLDIASVLIVVLGTFSATLIKFPIAHFIAALKTAGKAFTHQPEPSNQLIDQAIELSSTARRSGLMALEEVEVSNEFLRKGVQLLADGQEPEFVHKVLLRDINLTIARHERSEAVFRAIGDVAPAMGMIGTLIGLVQMLSNMDDPKQIGPAMAVALLTTLYGAIIANVFALPIADKLSHRSDEERTNRSLILESILSIQDGMNPKVMQELLHTYLPSRERPSLDNAGE